MWAPFNGLHPVRQRTCCSRYDVSTALTYVCTFSMLASSSRCSCASFLWARLSVARIRSASSRCSQTCCSARFIREMLACVLTRACIIARVCRRVAQWVRVTPTRRSVHPTQHIRVIMHVCKRTNTHAHTHEHTRAHTHV